MILFLATMFVLASCTTTTSSQNQGMAIRPEAPLSVHVEEDISYMEGRTLDIYTPEEDALWPIAILLHGGGGNSKSLAELSSSIASNGVIVFAPTWSSHPPQSSYITKGWDEVACSLRYVHTYAIERGISDTRVIIAGHSAGGASGFVALVAADELVGECLSTENPLMADAFIGIDGAYTIFNYIPSSRLNEGDPDEWERINPFHYLEQTHHQENLDIVLMTSYVEELVQDAEKFKKALEEVGYNAVHIRMPELDHYGVASPYPKVLEIIMDVIYPN
jgi:acetyl esterase/lipase